MSAEISKTSNNNERQRPVRFTSGQLADLVGISMGGVISPQGTDYVNALPHQQLADFLKAKEDEREARILDGLEDNDGTRAEHVAWRIARLTARFLESDALTHKVEFPLVDGYDKIEAAWLSGTSELLVERFNLDPSQRIITAETAGISVTYLGGVVVTSETIANQETGQPVHSIYTISRLLPVVG
jgi:hypothetical protein